MDSLLNTSGQQLPNNHFVDSQVKRSTTIYDNEGQEKFYPTKYLLAQKKVNESIARRPDT